MGTPNGGNTMAHEAEFLGMTPGYMEGRSVVVITFRPDPSKFATINYAISGTQFKRIIKDGLLLLELSDQLKADAEPLDPEAPPPSVATR